VVDLAVYYGAEARALAFVRKKRVGRYDYYQLVESRRVGGKPPQRVLLHHGRYPTVEAASEGWQREIERLRRLARKERERADRLSGKSPSMTRGQAALAGAEEAERKAEYLTANLRKLQDLRDQVTA